VSSYKNTPLFPYDVFIGEVGLTGEVRRTSKIESRCLEAYKMGFKRAFIPQKEKERLKLPKDFQIIGVNNINDVINAAFNEISF
ncbi:MAG TPA: S16 family serine protease, partial [Haloplasmataceae bacterium]